MKNSAMSCALVPNKLIIPSGLFQTFPQHHFYYRHGFYICYFFLLLYS